MYSILSVIIDFNETYPMKLSKGWFTEWGRGLQRDQAGMGTSVGWGGYQFRSRVSLGGRAGGGCREIPGHRCISWPEGRGLSCRGHPFLTHSLPCLTGSWLGVATFAHLGAFKEKTLFELLQDYRKVSRCLFKQVCLNRKIKQTGSYFSFSTYAIFEMISKDIFSHNWTVSGYQPFDQIEALYVVSHQRASKLQIKVGFRFCLWSSQINWILFLKVTKGTGKNTKIQAE